MGLFLCRCGQADDAADYEPVGTYDGETSLGMRHGKGVYYYKNGDIYDGQWKRGRKHGYGVYTYLDGTQKRGFLVEDEFIGVNPGSHFAEPKEEEDDPARPLDPLCKLSPREIAEREAKLRLAQQRLEEGEKRRAARKKKREEVRQKYNLK
ncbi:MORN repeat-containing protein 1 [Exaiptasia diaphana]|uniref:Radial spoke head 1 homolog n=1 Tax=Exaiptasia diaphana TaxID=2652724 RepID=A0A913X6E2_EXADI|nr:MORN repeat-containing protein 1 [Exaiptasia diaphana]